MISAVLKRRKGRIISALAVLIFGLLAWLGVTAWQVKNDLEVVRAEASAARTSILDGDTVGAERAAALASVAAREASDNTHGILWSAASFVPWVGTPMKSVRQMSDAVADLTTNVLVPTTEVASALDPDEIRRGNTLDTLPLRTARPAVAMAAKSAVGIADRVAVIDPTWLGPVADAQRELNVMVQQASTMLQASSVAAELLPGMTGADGPRNYFLAFQTPSEARGTGGLVGGFGILNASNGRLTVPELGSNRELVNPAIPRLNLGAEYDALYRYYMPYTDYRNNNLSPSFPHAAAIWIANWRAQTGQKLDGAIALDPIALSYVLRVTGPVTLVGGEVITADNVVDITLASSYVRFADDNQARKAYLQSIASAVVEQAANFDGNAGDLLEALGKGVYERRIMVYSSRSEEQVVLQTTKLAHHISDTDSPYLQVTVGNAGGNKLDYYLRREISYGAANCVGETRESVVNVKLTNTLKDLALPDYVIAPNGTTLGVEKGTNLANVEFLTTRGAAVKEITVDGQSAFYTELSLEGRPFVSTRVAIPPGSTVEVNLKLIEPTTALGPAEVPVQPLVDTPAVTVDVPECRKVHR